MTIQIYKASNTSALIKTDAFEKGCWVRIFEPTEAELQELHKSHNVPLDFLTDPLDLNEGSRIEKDEGFILIIIRSPIQEEIDDEFFFETIPMGVILQDTTIYTICAKPIPLLAKYIKHGNQDITLHNKKTIILKLLQNSALLILSYLKNIEKKHEYLEKKMARKKTNEDLIDLHNLKKSLVYFTAAIKGNISVLDKLKRNQLLSLTEEELESIDDIWVDMNQALSLCETHTITIVNTLNTFTSLISNELTNVMRLLAGVTVFLVVPTLLTSIYGMNGMEIPFAHNAHHIFLFSLFFLFTFLVSIFILRKKKWI